MMNADQRREFLLWLLIHVIGLAVDMGISALGAHCTFGLQMSLVRRLFINAVFSADVLYVCRHHSNRRPNES